MEFNTNLLGKLADKCFAEESERSSFIDCFSKDTNFPQAIVWLKPRPDGVDFNCLPPSPWQPSFVDLLSSEQRPGKNPLHEQGYYYCLDLGSVFEVVPLQLLNSSPVVLDLCASPGGKSVIATAMLKPRLLVANEVIGKRSAQLISNFKRCLIPNSSVYQNDSAIFMQNVSSCFDIVIVDAPCSGQSLLLKGTKNPGCFHHMTIKLNYKRQRRILANAVNCVAPGGHLLYSTCTYSREENEGNVEWLCRDFPEFEAVEVGVLSGYRSSLSSLPCYRLWPQSGIAAGGFTALFRRRENNLERGSLSGLQTMRKIWSAD